MLYAHTVCTHIYVTNTRPHTRRGSITDISRLPNCHQIESRIGGHHKCRSSAGLEPDRGQLSWAIAHNQEKNQIILDTTHRLLTCIRRSFVAPQPLPRKTMGIMAICGSNRKTCNLEKRKIYKYQLGTERRARRWPESPATESLLKTSFPDLCGRLPAKLSVEIYQHRFGTISERSPQEIIRTLTRTLHH